MLITFGGKIKFFVSSFELVTVINVQRASMVHTLLPDNGSKKKYNSHTDGEELDWIIEGNLQYRSSKCSNFQNSAG